ncbi:Holliday junction resolvase RuvX [Coxiella endosymbiont of Amblyomma sculptum]|uniref:Holliday junction resolvase RuvX n=1 Tax=Coxiella endosymbiont of Amblyomma sculptum TaxID=2487929 RepID=UPI001C553E78|nr:Holliday junction resolvase RuvX [Coxiella endosymbiont of Amblyomma sculptum]
MVLGFDFGLKRIGIAVGQTLTRSAHPNTILKSKNGIPWKQINEIIKIWEIDTLVVGIPYNMDGSEQFVTYAARKFANTLRSKTDLPVYTVDERLTTVEARKLYFNRKKNFKFPKQFDSYAAKIILEQWLQENTDPPK